MSLPEILTSTSSFKYISGRTFAPGKLRRSSRIILRQQRLPTPIQLLAVGGGVGVDVAYQGKETDLRRIYPHGTH